MCKRFLCDDALCNDCYFRSFASNIKAKYWSKKNTVLPRQVLLHSSRRVWFDCPDCPHDFESMTDSITRGSWCPYCAHMKMCDNKDCIWCFAISFASHYRACHWSPLNTLTPRQVFQSSNAKYLFLCDICALTFSAILSNVTRVDSWCPTCKRKTERMLYEFLRTQFSTLTVQRNAKFEWCKNPATNSFFPFDIAIPSLRIIFELDGNQHFKQIMNWQTPESQQIRDCDKMNFAWCNDYWLVRIVQVDVYRRLWQWQNVLTSIIEQRKRRIDVPSRVIFVEKECTTIISKVNDRARISVYENVPAPRTKYDAHIALLLHSPMFQDNSHCTIFRYPTPRKQSPFEISK